MGHLSFTLAYKSREIMVLTLTQTIFSIEPKFLDNSFKACLKVEGFILEGIGNEDNLLPLIGSEHLKDSPAYFLKVDCEKTNRTNCSYRLSIIMDSIEYIHNKVRVEQIKSCMKDVFVAVYTRNYRLSVYSKLLYKCCTTIY